MNKNDVSQEETYPEVLCPKCGDIVIPLDVKFMQSNKSFQILCPKCERYTIMPKDEHYDAMLQYFLDTGKITQEDLEKKWHRPKIGKRRKRMLEKELEKELEEEKEFESEEREFTEYELLEEIVSAEKQLQNYQKRHLLEWAKLKTLSAQEVHSLLVGLGASDSIAKKIATAYGYALQKEKMKKERYKDAVDTIYRGSVTPAEPETSHITEPISYRREHYQPPQYHYYPPPYTYQRFTPQQGFDINSLVEFAKTVRGDTGKRYEELEKKILELKEENLKKEFQMEFSKRDQALNSIANALQNLQNSLAFGSKPKEIQELEIKKDSLESFGNRIENIAQQIMDFVNTQSAIKQGIVPRELALGKASEDESKAAVEKLKKAAKKTKKVK